jgi:hypothetical protein
VNEVEKAELTTLFALFVEYHVDPNSYCDLEDLYQDYRLKFPKEWLESTISDWEDRGWVDVARSHSGTSARVLRTRYAAVLKQLLPWLGGTSLTVDARKEEILSDADPTGDVPMRNGWKWFTYQADAPTAITETAVVVPAADRFVPLDHNLPEYLQVKEGLEEIYEASRSANDLPDRDRILRSLDAAKALWDAVELRAIQIKIGVIMAIEDAGRALANTAKAVAAALLIDTIKSLVKSQTGMDLDHL